MTPLAAFQGAGRSLDQQSGDLVDAWPHIKAGRPDCFHSFLHCSARLEQRAVSTTKPLPLRPGVWARSRHSSSGINCILEAAVSKLMLLVFILQ